MRTAVCVGAALVLACASSGAQGVDRPPSAASGYYDGAEEPAAVPTKRALRPIPGYPQGGPLPSGGTRGAGPGVSPRQANPRYPVSRTYYEYNPNAARPDSYGRMRSSGGQDVDVRGDRMGADWYRNLPAPNYDYRSGRY